MLEFLKTFQKFLAIYGLEIKNEIFYLYHILKI